MWRRGGPAIGLVALVGVVAAWMGGSPAGDPPDAAVGDGDGSPIGTSQVAALRAFDACDELTGWLARKAEPYVEPWGLRGGFGGAGFGVLEEATVALDAAAPQAVGGRTADTPAFSGTNVQEAGVDEPDQVKTDGRRLFTVRDDRLLQIDLSGDVPRVAADHALADPQGGPHQADLLLAGDRLLVLWQGWADDPAAVGDEDAAMMSSRMVPGRSVTHVRLFDIAGDGPQLVEAAELDGQLVSGRLHGTTARLVLRNQPTRLPLVAPRTGEPADLEAARRANVDAVAHATPSQWLGWMEVTDLTGPTAVTSRRPMSRCEDVHHTGEFSGFGTLDVLTVPLDGSLDDADATSVLTGAETVYASTQHLYVTTYAWPAPELALPVEPGIAPGAPPPGRPAPAPEDFTTEIHAFDVTDPERTAYVGSGQVPGHVLNQFSLSEHAGHLRVATTVGAPWNGGSESGVHVLRLADGRLTEVGHIGDLGRGERIYAVRYVGDTAYVVTFRQVDPLYTLDLSDPGRPQLLGELKIPGYSAYLHPVGEDLLIGVGQDATLEGRTLGTQVSLFDVRDLRDPLQVAKTVVSDAHSDAEFDHHAFLYWARTGLTVIPVSTWGRTPWTGAIAFSVDGTALTRLGELSHVDQAPGQGRDRFAMVDAARITRSLVVGDDLITLSHAGLLTSDVRTLETRHWLALG